MAKSRIMFTIHPEALKAVEAYQKEEDLLDRSEAIRSLINKGLKYEKYIKGTHHEVY